MRFDKRDLELYVVTDQHWLNGKDFLKEIELIIKNGATMIQLREKEMPKDTLIKLAKDVLELCKQYEVPFIINDDVEVALLVGADGVHVGQNDLEANKVREKIGPYKILGVSAQTVEQAEIAKRQGADYIGVGALFHTKSKDDAVHVSLETLSEIIEEVNIPVVGIGGIDEYSISKLGHLTLDGVAVISAIFTKEDVGLATKELKKLTKFMIKKES